jgi:hypothetical protein
MMGYSTNRSEKADPDSAESVDETLAETLRPLTLRYLVPAAIMRSNVFMHRLLIVRAKN